MLSSLPPTLSLPLPPSLLPPSLSPSPLQPGMMTVKVHYSTTRAVRVSSSITYQQLQLLICKKFDRPEGSLTLWCKKKTGELNEIDSEAALKEVSASPDDGFRITVWAYDKHEEVGSVFLTHLIKVVRTPLYKGHFTESQIHSFSTNQVRPSLYKGQNVVPQWWPLVSYFVRLEIYSL